MPKKNALNTARQLENLGEEELTEEEKAANAAEAAGEPAEPVTEPAEPAEPAQPEPEKKQHEKYVDYDRFKQANDARLKAEQEAAQYREQFARFDERAKLVKEAQDRAAKAEDDARRAKERPDPDIDPAGARAWDAIQRAEQLQAKVTQLESQFQTRDQQIQGEISQGRVQAYLYADVARTQALHPDYPQAYDYLRNMRMQHQMALGYTPEQAAQLWDLEANAYTQQAARTGVSVTQFAYQLATQLGYQVPAANGGVRQAAQPQVLANGRQKLDQINNGQKVQGLGRTASGTAEPNADLRNMTAAEIADMPEDEFTDIMNDPVRGKILANRMAELDLA